MCNWADWIILYPFFSQLDFTSVRENNRTVKSAKGKKSKTTDHCTLFLKILMANILVLNVKYANKIRTFHEKGFIVYLMTREEDKRMTKIIFYQKYFSTQVLKYFDGYQSLTTRLIGEVSELGLLLLH